MNFNTGKLAHCAIFLGAAPALSVGLKAYLDCDGFAGQESLLAAVDPSARVADITELSPAGLSSVKHLPSAHAAP